MPTFNGPDPIEVMERLRSEIRPYDPHPGAPVLSVEMRLGRSRGTFESTERATRALYEV